LIGTSALLHRELGDKGFDYVVVDEEQKLSVDFKFKLMKPTSHQLIASATPIPRTTALAEHGGVEILRLKQCHVKKNIITKIIEKKENKALMNDVMGIVKRGGKVLVVCPKREDDEQSSSELISADDVAKKFENFAPGLVRLSHGGMSSEDNQQALEDVKNGVARILISTTVVEVGINIPDLWCVVVVHPERMGLSTLHQIRGRVIRKGENNHVGYCYLYCPTDISEKSRERLIIMENERDGFEIAKQDMLMRGIGDVSTKGKSQHGASDALCIGKKVDVAIIEEVLQKLENGFLEQESA
jgi:ATP-dependent DNA helicase RecG